MADLLLYGGLLALLVLWLVYRFSGLRQRLLQRRARRILAQAARAESPRRRRELLLHLQETGAPPESRRAQVRRSAREEGRRARTAGRPRSANPYLISLWGKGREWKAGWRSVDRNVRWLHRQRRG